MLIRCTSSFMFRCFILLASCMLVSSCSQRHAPAPVVEVKWHSYSSRQLVHVVRRNETLYAIAFRYDKDYRQLAELNHLRPPFALQVGQRIRLTKGSPVYRSNYTPTTYAPTKTVWINKPVARPMLRKTPVSFARKNSPIPSGSSANAWVWPVQGRVVTHFFPSQGKKGIDIAGKKGDVVRAAGSGIVAYSGSGLSGYGHLIIIKHQNQFLTAYGDNLKNVVKEGQNVKAGQVIAEIGIVDRKFWGVHFEIRKSGQPVNPVNYLRK